jgi:serine/threonine protein kinase/Tol biopolymer transport system component
MRLAAGMKLDGYEILGSIGAGGMGEVYRARDSVLKREVAIKVLPLFVSQEPDRLRRFEQEAQAAAALNHPNILVVYQFGTFEGAPYLVSELLEGATLRQQLGHGPLPVRKAIDDAVQVARGLAAAHEKEIVHRDLKPENLFITKDGRVKILDFGLAKLTQRQPVSDGMGPTLNLGTELGVVLGTAGYMSPEQVRGKTVDHRTDIFAFGAILYEMLTGKRAFQRSTSAETMTAILNDDPPGISQIAQTTPPGLQRVVHRCLEKNPEQRFHSAHDLAFALEALSESGSAAVTGSIVPARTVHKWTWAAAALILVALAIGWYLRRPLPPPRVSRYQKITNDAHRKAFVGTDGIRLYLNRYTDSQPLAQAAVAGGKIEPIPVTLPEPWMLDVSSDGSALLVRSTDGEKHSLWSMGTLGGSLRHLSDDNVASAVWSADGKQIAYSTLNGQVHVMRSDGTGAHLVPGPSFTGNLAWSPDGRFIRFTKDGRYWEMSSEGSNPHPLLPGWHPTAIQSDGRWTPQGFFVFASREVSSGSVFMPEAVSQIWLLDERRQPLWQTPVTPVQLTSSPMGLSRPFPSKDGATIFARGVNLHGELDRYDRKSGQIQPYLGGISAESVTFSPDGRFVAYVGFPEGIMWRANRDGTNPVRLTDPPLYPIGLRWSPDGNEILFATNLEGRTKSYAISVQGGAPQPILPEDKGTQSDPNWSPDGHKIVFSTAEAGALTLGPERIFDLATHQVSTIPGSEGTRSPRWSPDGRFIAVIFGFNGLKIFDFKTKGWTVLEKGQTGYPTWSRDSRYIYFLRWGKDRGVYRVHVLGREVERVIDLKGFPLTGVFKFWMGLDPEDAPILLRDAGTDEIYALPLEEK